MEEHDKTTESGMTGSTAAWIVSFVLFPYGPFVYLAKIKVVTKTFAVITVLASAAVHVGMVSVLSETDDQPWQHWLVLLMGVGMYLLGALQYIAGQRKMIWSEKGQKNWRQAGWFFGCVLLLDLLAHILLFHLLSTGGTPTP